MTKRSGASRRKKAKKRAAAAAAAAAAAYPPWVLLEHYCVNEVEGSSSSIADLTTLASCRTASGSPIAAALCVAPPPEPSRVCIQPPGDATMSYSEVVAAHGDSVLIAVCLKEGRMRERVDEFVYSAGDAAGDPPRPPSLILLPPFYPDEKQTKFCHRLGLIPEARQLHTDSAGLLRRRGEDEDEIVVAELEMEMDLEKGTDTKAPELVLFRSGDWSIRRPQFSHGKDDPKLSNWYTRGVVPVGDRTLCWSDGLHGVIFSDVFDDDPTLRYVPFPVESRHGFAVCATTGGGGAATVKAVNIFPHCRCFDDDDDRWSSDEGECWCSIDTFTITTWMLRMDDMTWVIDGKVDSDELWALDAYQGLPRHYLRYPVVSLDDPDAITFELCKGDQRRPSGATAGDG